MPKKKTMRRAKAQAKRCAYLAEMLSVPESTAHQLSVQDFEGYLKAALQTDVKVDTVSLEPRRPGYLEINGRVRYYVKAESVLDWAAGRNNNCCCKEGRNDH